MTHKPRTFHRLALGVVAVAAILPASAHARPLGLDSTDLRAIHEQAVPPKVSSVVGAEDLAFSRQSAGNPAVVTTDRDDGYDAGSGSVAGLLLILAATGVAVAVHHGRKAKLAPA